MRHGGVAVWRAAGRSQAIQVSHDDHSGLTKVDGQVVILRQGQVAQETLIWTQRGCEDLETTAKLHEILISFILNQKLENQDILMLPRETQSKRKSLDGRIDKLNAFSVECFK